MSGQLFALASTVIILGFNAQVSVSSPVNASSYQSVYAKPANTSITDINKVLSGTGAPGIYDSSYTPDDQYGEYNWCDMPHVRKTEYVKPADGYDLQYVEVIQRHHKRTPYASNTFFKEDISWNCTDEGPYAFAKNSGDLKSTPVYWQAQKGTVNPFEKTVGPGFVGSTCQFPAITSQGLDDAFQHGVDLRGVYCDMLGFLPDVSEKDKYAFRVTNNVITSQTMGGLVNGLFPGIEEHSAWIQSSSYDSLEPAITCAAANSLKSASEGNNPAWLDHLNRSADVRARFNNISGIQPMDTAGWNTSWDHPYDNLSAKQCHGKTLPCSTNSTSLCLSQDDANEIYRLGNWEYAYRYRLATTSLQYSSLKMGPWVRELIAHIDGVVNGSWCMKYFHNFAHDGSMAPLLGLLQIDEPVWPGMGSEVVFELWKKDNANYMRVLWKGQPLKTSTWLGTLDMIKLDDFKTYLDQVIPQDLVAACAATSSS